MDEILFEVVGAVGRVTLNRPKALNALTLAMTRELDARLIDWAADERIAAVVVEGAGDRAFCAGGDIRALYASMTTPGDRFSATFYREEYTLNHRIHAYPKPYIALIDGVVMGGGVGVSVHGSHRVVTENVLFAMPETGIGLFPDVGATHFLPRIPGALGMYLGLTGARLRAADVMYAGVGTHFVPRARLGELVDALAACRLRIVWRASPRTPEIHPWPSIARQSIAASPARRSRRSSPRSRPRAPNGPRRRARRSPPSRRPASR